ncbi:hypothetical protein POM88_033952 [Heracleum sosnowskyi]|uniref:Uncharacterized protein n=1 Tax=Heracleum sosnowskyi TaxID=360622 RepID=A0AAD8MA43_9APIA|nr:hypothetical protein POM88_033952 [Heracleum sosnowskyi]
MTNLDLKAILKRCMMLWWGAVEHPQQHCIQDDIDMPKSLTEESAAVGTTTCGEIVPVSSQELVLGLLQVRLLNVADLDQLLAELRGVEVEQERTKGEATDAFEEGYFA